MLALTHTPQSHRTVCLWKKNNTRLPAEKIQEPSNAALKSQHSLEREKALNYKSRSFKQLWRLAGSFVWCLQKLITCFYKDGPHFGFVWLSLSLSLSLQTKPLAGAASGAVSPWGELLSSCGTGSDIAAKCHGCQYHFGACLILCLCSIKHHTVLHVMDHLE